MFQSTVARCWWCCSGACRAAADWAETLPVPDADCRLEPRRTAALYSRPPCYWAATAGEHQHQLLGLHPLEGKLLFSLLSGVCHAQCQQRAVAQAGAGWCSAELVTATQTSHAPAPPTPAATHAGILAFISGRVAPPLPGKYFVTVHRQKRNYTP